MEENVDSLRSPNAPGGRGRPIVLVGRLMQQAANMQHVDEVFLWLAQTLVQYLDIAVVQFLAIQQDDAKQFQVEMRASASQDPALAQIGYVNNQVMAVAERIFRERRGIMSRPVESVFPAQQAALLAQYNLRCWAGYFLCHDALLPPAKDGRTPGKTPMPFNIIVSLFTLYPLSMEQTRAIHFIMEQAMRIIVNRGLLATRQAPGMVTKKMLDVNELLAHAHLIPQRSENIEHVQANNPFASASIITDKNARRLYTAINGDKDLAKLAQMTGLRPKEMLAALHYLFEQQKIHFYTPKGELVQNPTFLSSLS